MENTIEVNSMEDVVKTINSMNCNQEFIVNVDCFKKENEDKRDGR